MLNVSKLKLLALKFNRNVLNFQNCLMQISPMCFVASKKKLMKMLVPKYEIFQITPYDGMRWNPCFHIVCHKSSKLEIISSPLYAIGQKFQFEIFQAINQADIASQLQLSDTCGFLLGCCAVLIENCFLIINISH